MLKPSQKIIPALKELTVSFHYFIAVQMVFVYSSGNTFSWWIVKDEFFSCLVSYKVLLPVGFIFVLFC